MGKGENPGNSEIRKSKANKPPAAAATSSLPIKEMLPPISLQKRAEARIRAVRATGMTVAFKPPLTKPPLTLTSRAGL
jgi:hypothetical protein